MSGGHSHGEIEKLMITLVGSAHPTVIETDASGHSHGEIEKLMITLVASTTFTNSLSFM